jgi:hypothetical protein
MSTSNEWLVAVFKCKPAETEKTIVDFYRYIDNQKGVRSLHFLVTDRIEDEVVFSFRVMVEPKLKEIIKSKSAAKLNTLLGADRFAIDPTVDNNLREYVSWFPEKKLAQVGQARFTSFIDFLKNLSALVVDAIEKNYLASSERVEIAHIFSSMLGCTEYGMLRTTGMEVGYYDSLEDKYCSYLRQTFPQPNESKKKNNT